jgi:hypothetical protein
LSFIDFFANINIINNNFLTQARGDGNEYSDYYGVNMEAQAKMVRIITKLLTV